MYSKLGLKQSEVTKRDKTMNTACNTVDKRGGVGVGGGGGGRATRLGRGWGRGVRETYCVRGSLIKTHLDSNETRASARTTGKKAPIIIHSRQKQRQVQKQKQILHYCHARITLQKNGTS